MARRNMAVCAPGGEQRSAPRSRAPPDANAVAGCSATAGGGCRPKLLGCAQALRTTAAAPQRAPVGSVRVRRRRAPAAKAVEWRSRTAARHHRQGCPQSRGGSGQATDRLAFRRRLRDPARAVGCLSRACLRCASVSRMQRSHEPASARRAQTPPRAAPDGAVAAGAPARRRPTCVGNAGRARKSRRWQRCGRC
jgi:hypothetical protein